MQELEGVPLEENSEEKEPVNSEEKEHVFKVGDLAMSRVYVGYESPSHVFVVDEVLPDGDLQVTYAQFVDNDNWSFDVEHALYNKTRKRAKDVVLVSIDEFQEWVKQWSQGINRENAALR